MTYTKQEQRFLERLGITPGPWILDESDNYVYSKSGGICDVRQSGYDALLISQAPDMFLSLWDYVRTMFYIRQQINSSSYAKFYEKAIKRIEKATGKNLPQLLEIWEECK